VSGGAARRLRGGGPPATCRAVLRSPGKLSPVKDHHQGRAWRRVADASAILETDLPRQDLGTCQDDGGRVVDTESLRRFSSGRVARASVIGRSESMNMRPVSGPGLNDRVHSW
jgi:hypothetical protein